MTLDNDGNASPHAPRIPTDPPPRAGAQTGAGGVAAPARTPADAPSQSKLMAELGDGRCLDAPRVAPRIVRCPLPAGVERVEAPDGTTFLPPIEDDGYPRSLVRSILAGAPRNVALVTSITVAAWARTLAALTRAVDAAEDAFDAAPRPDLTTNDGFARGPMRTATRELGAVAARAAGSRTLDTLAAIEGAALWRAMLAAWFGASAAELAELRHDAEGLDAFADDLDAFAAG